MKKLNNFIEKYRFMLLFFIVSSILIHLALFTKDILTADVLLNAIIMMVIVGKFL